MPIYALGDRQPRCAADTWIADNATLIGSVVLESGASVFFGTVVRGDTDLITIGAGSNVQDNSVLHTDAGIPLTLGQGVTVGHRAVLHGCSIGDGSLIGIGAIVMNRAVIARRCLVAAGALVPEGKTYPERSLILGSPAKAVRALSDAEVEQLRLSAEDYLARWQSYLGRLRRVI